MEDLRKQSDDKKAEKQVNNSCKHCSRYVVIPLYEGQIDTCHWVGSTEKENDLVYTDNLVIKVKEDGGEVKESDAQLFRIKKDRAIYCEFHKSQNNKL